MSPSDALHGYYASNDERDRLSTVRGQLEFVRSQEIVQRHLPATPSVVVDVGGAAGKYSCWLARLGHVVHLVDPVAALVEQAREASAEQADRPIRSCTVGDARSLEFGDESADAVLMMGPLYHLTEPEDRQTALAEAKRVLRPGGVLFAAAISRFASAIDGLVHEFALDAEFRRILERDLREGQHRNHTGQRLYFTDSYFHEPDELQAELSQAGFESVEVLPIEGIAYLLGNLDSYWSDTGRRELLLGVLRRLETAPSLRGATAHLMSVGHRPR